MPSPRLNRLGIPKPWQGCPISSDQKDRLDQIPTGLLDRQHREVRIKQRPVDHHPVYRQFQLLADLIKPQLGHLHIAPAFLGEPGMRIIVGRFATFDRNTYPSTLLWCDLRAAGQRRNAADAGQKKIKPK